MCDRNTSVDRRGGSEEPRARLICERAPDRRSLRKVVEIRYKAGVVLRGLITDVSENGCRIETPFFRRDVGQLIYVKIDCLEPWPGLIRWTSVGAIGVEFLQQLYPPVVDHLVK